MPHHLMWIVHCLGIVDLIAFLHSKHILDTSMHHWVKEAVDGTLWSYSTSSFIHIHSVQIVHDVPCFQLHTYVGNVVHTLDDMEQG